MQIRPGSLLIAHPTNAHPNRTNQVVYVTESNPFGTTGLIFNDLSKVNLRNLLVQKGIDWQGDNNLYIGGDSNPNALVMLHSDEWYSQNTVQVDGYLAMSSDGVMMEKLEMGDVPQWYRLFVGYEAWDPSDLEHQIKSSRPEWILLATPSQALLELADDNLWQTAVTEYSQDVFDSYF